MLSKSKWFCLFFVVLVSGCTAIQPVTPIQPVRKDLVLKDLCDGYKVDCSWDTLSQIVILEQQGLKARALIDSDVVLLNDQVIFLNAPVTVKKSLVMVPPDFKSKVLERLKKEAPLKGKIKGTYTYRKVNMVIVDPGHGGKDPGAIGRTGLKEKEVVLDIAKRVKKLLLKQGFKVKMTREADRFISLKNRTQMASRSDADIFVSIHANAHRIRSVFGVEVFSLKDLGYFDKNEKQRKINHNLLFKRLQMNRGDVSTKKILEDMMYSHKQSESGLLAGFIVQRISSFGRTKNRGLKKSHFYVLRNTLIPAILVEVGFLSNPKEERLLRTSAYRQKVARAIVKGILDYANAK